LVAGTYSGGLPEKYGGEGLHDLTERKAKKALFWVTSFLVRKRRGEKGGLASFLKKKRNVHLTQF